MFKNYHMLPDEVGRQNPRILMDMLDNLNNYNDEEEDYTGGDPYLKMFYGM